MKRIELLLTEEQYAAVAQTAYDSEKVYGEHIPLNAVIMTAVMRGVPILNFEIDAAKKKLIRTIRLVK